MWFDPVASGVQREDGVEAGRPEMDFPVRESSWKVDQDPARNIGT